MTQPTNIEDILVLSKDSWDMSYDLEASQKKLDEIITSTYLQAVEAVVGGAFARCLELKQEIVDQEEEWGIADRSTIDRLSEAEKNYAELNEALQSLKQTKE